MKRLILSVATAIMMAVPAINAQTTPTKVDKEGILKKIEKSNADIANPKKSAKVATWLVRAQVFFEAETKVSESLFGGVDKTMAAFMYGQPLASEQVQVGNSAFEKITYPDFVVYANEAGVFNAWEITNIIWPGAMDEAIAAYNKAYELDTDKKNAAKIEAGLKAIFDQLYKDGSIFFTLANYADAGAAFEKAYQVSTYPGYGKVDEEAVASLAHDTGVAYLFDSNFPKSVEFFTIAENKGYEREGEIYYLIYHAYRGISGTDKEVLRSAKAMLEKGLSKYPDNANIIECMTDVYVALGEEPADIVPTVRAAIEKDPNNPALWNGLGRLYERLGDIDQSILAFEHVAELMPTNFNAYFSVGILYVRQADEKLAEVNDSNRTYSGQAEYDAALQEAYAIYIQAFGPLEKAHELNPSDRITVELLKNVSFRLRDQDGMMDKYNKYNELLKTMPEE